MSSTCAMRSSYVVAGGNAYVEKEDRVAALAENYSTSLASLANYTIHLLPILRHLYYTALRRAEP